MFAPTPLCFDVPCQKRLHILGYNTHPKFRLHKQPCINVSFSIFCSLDLQSLQTWLSVAAMIKKPSLQKLTSKPVSFSLKHFTMPFSFSAYILPDVKRLWSVSSQKKNTLITLATNAKLLDG